MSQSEKLEHANSTNIDYAATTPMNPLTNTVNNPSNNNNHYQHNGYPLSQVATNNSIAMHPAFAAELQPGLYRPDPGHRKFANPVPLGLMGFAGTTFLLSIINFQTDGITVPNMVASLAFSWGGLVQLLAGMWDLACGNTFGATVLSSYGAFWVAVAIILSPGYGMAAAYPTVAEFNHAFGMFLMTWFITTFLFTLMTLKSTVVFFLLFFWVDLTFLCLGIGYLSTNVQGAANTSWVKAGGMFGLLAAFFAWYVAVAGMADKSNSFFTVPVWHFPWSDTGKQIKRAKSKSSEKAERSV